MMCTGHCGSNPSMIRTINYLDYCGKIYHLLQKNGVGADVLSYDADWSAYKLIILPGAFHFKRNASGKTESVCEKRRSSCGNFFDRCKERG